MNARDTIELLAWQTIRERSPELSAEERMRKLVDEFMSPRVSAAEYDETLNRVAQEMSV